MVACVTVDAREHYRALAARVDRFFEKAHEQHRADMECASGCADCCHVRLTVSLIEAAEIAEGVASLPPAVRERLRRRAADREDPRCPALDDDGCCTIYRWRPLVCRSHGVPVRTGENRVTRLPVVEVCPRNFKQGLDGVASDAILDQETLSTVLGAVDNAYAAEVGADKGSRLSLDELFSAAG